MSTDIAAAAERDLRDCSSYVFFSEDGDVLASSFKPDPAELRPLAEALLDREASIQRGMIINGTRYEVHRHHPPLVYGRTTSADPDASEGAAICAVPQGLGGKACYGVITYRMPQLSARMVPILQAFCQQQLQKAAHA